MQFTRMRNARAARRHRSRDRLPLESQSRTGARDSPPPLIAYFASVSDFRAQRSVTITEFVDLHPVPFCPSVGSPASRYYFQRVFARRNLLSLVLRHDILNGEFK